MVQLLQPVRPANTLNLPAGHAAQSSALAAAPKNPTAQLAHTLWPESSAKVPGTQSSHAVAPWKRKKKGWGWWEGGALRGWVGKIHHLAIR